MSIVTLSLPVPELMSIFRNYHDWFLPIIRCFAFIGWAMIFNSGCTLDSFNLKHGHHTPLQRNQIRIFLRGSQQWYFIKVPQVILMWKQKQMNKQKKKNKKTHTQQQQQQNSKKQTKKNTQLHLGDAHRSVLNIRHMRCARTKIKTIVRCVFIVTFLLYVFPDTLTSGALLTSERPKPISPSDLHYPGPRPSTLSTRGPDPRQP